MYKLTGITAKLETTDIDKTIEFYTEHLGFKLTGRFQGQIFLSKDEQTIMFHEMMEHHGQKKPVMTGSLYLYTMDVDDIYKSVKDKVKLSYPINDFEYGMREFGMYDCNGYLLQVGRAINMM